MRPASQRCPLCRKPADSATGWYPFCSRRCRTQDLANWATGSYAIPAPASEADEHLEPVGDRGDGHWDD